ncbi:MAG: helix-turn-helix domain-containing protein [Marinospirillum sp.]|nr:helix-turn-helix domain-containing protein [Marinospirillum sp.]
MMLEQYEELMTKCEVARVLRISLNTLNTWCSRNPRQLPPFIKLGSAKNSVIRFRKRDVINFIDK